MQTVYLVWGTNGQDYSASLEWDVAVYTSKEAASLEWDVAVYTSKEAADKHADLANEWIADYAKRTEMDAGGFISLEVNPYDPIYGVLPKFRARHFRYTVSEIQLCRHVDEFLENIGKGAGQ